MFHYANMASGNMSEHTLLHVSTYTCNVSSSYLERNNQNDNVTKVERSDLAGRNSEQIWPQNRNSAKSQAICLGPSRKNQDVGKLCH